jgi:hypothetical protein
MDRIERPPHQRQSHFFVILLEFHPSSRIAPRFQKVVLGLDAGASAIEIPEPFFMQVVSVVQPEEEDDSVTS